MKQDKPQRYSHFCLRCSYEWFSKLFEPVRCAYCKNPYWNIPKRIVANIAI